MLSLKEVQASLQELKRVKPVPKNQPLIEAIVFYTQSLDTTIPLLARIKLLRTGLTTAPKCPQCGANLHWVDSMWSWQEYCSTACANTAKWGTPCTLQAPVNQAKVQQTMLDRYGAKNAMQSAELRDKAKATVQRIYGVDNVSRSEAIKEKKKVTCQKNWGTDAPQQATAVQTKTRATNKVRYGTDYPVQSTAVQEKTKVTNQERYGTDYQVGSSQTRDKIKQTFQERYGEEHICAFTVPEVKAKIQKTLQHRYNTLYPAATREIKKKIQETMLRLYGVTNPSQSPILRAKAQQTSQKHYGILNPRWAPEVQQKVKNTLMQSHAVMHPMQSPVIAQRATLSRLQKKYSAETLQKLVNPDFWQQEYVTSNKPLYQIALELGSSPSTVGRYMAQVAPHIEVRENTQMHSFQEKVLQEWLEAELDLSFFPTTLKQIMKDQGQDRDVNSRYTLDLYLPDKNLAIEYNGLYWHSTDFHPDPLYHLKKTEACEALGIRLIHIWEDDWNLHRDIMESKLKSILGQTQAQRLHARQLTVVVPTAQQKRDFYDAHHIKGDGVGSVNYALQIPETGQLVAMFTVKRTTDPNVMDLNRFAVDTEFHIPGAFSKLLKHYEREATRTHTLITYADRCWSQGNVYLKNGFTLTHTSPPAFHGVEFGERISRRAYTHERLAKRFPQTYDPNLTQLENLALAGIPVVYDCGNYAFTKGVSVHQNLHSFELER
jgi:hypothetical protein